MIIPFVLLYTKNVQDANYNVPVFSAFIVIANAGFCLQNIYKMVVKAAGHYKKTQTASIIEHYLLRCRFTFKTAHGINQSYGLGHC